MNKNILKVFNVESSEQTIVFLLLFQSLFIGVFYGSFSIEAETLFTGAFEPMMISRALFVSGIIGILFTILYSFLQSQMRFAFFSVINILFVVGLTIISRFGFEVIPEKYLIFILFIIFGPLHIVTQVAFWGSATRIFSLRQGKRLFGLIDTGWAIGIILMTLVNLILLQFNFQTKNLLLFSIGSIIGVLLFQIIIVKYIKVDSSVSDSTKIKKHSQIKFSEMFKDKYISSIIYFVALSVMVLVFIYTSFLSVTQVKYPDEGNRGQFFSAVLLTVMVFSILLKTFAYDNLMKTYGLKIGIMLGPIIIGIFAVLTSVIGVFGYTAEAKMFIFFFLLIALSRMLSVSLNYSIEKPSSKLLYQSLKKAIRFDVQAKIDGTINEISFLISGLVILLIGLLSFIKIIHYSWLLVIVATAWVFSGIRLYQQYKNSLESSLQETNENIDTNKEISQRDSLINFIKNEKIEFSKKIVGINLLKTIYPFIYDEIIQDFCINGSEFSKEYAVKEITEMQLIKAKDILIKSNENLTLENLKEKIDLLKNKMDKRGKLIKKEKNRDLFLKSDNVFDRIFLSQYLIMPNVYDSKNDSSYLSALLRDINPQVRQSAIKTVTSLNTKEHFSSIVDNLSESKYFNISYNALKKIGDPSLYLLEQLYNKSDIELKTQRRILKLYGEIGGEKAINFLTDKLNIQNLSLLNQLALSLRKCNYQATESKSQLIHQSIHLVISVLAWNLAIKLSLDEKMNVLLVKPIQEELDMNYDLLFQLLSLAYNPKSVEHVKENLETGTGEGIGFAIELLDLFVSEDIKRQLITLLEDTPLPEKIKRLQVEYPVDKMETKDMLNSIINRDINYISNWTKTCALYSYLNLEEEKPGNDIIAHLFNPDKILYETAAFVVYQKDKEIFNSVINRLDKEIIPDIEENIYNNSVNNYNLVIEKVLFIKKNPYFSTLSGDLAVRIAKLTDIVTIDIDQEIIIDSEDKKLYIIVEGKVEMYDNEESIKIFNKDELITEDYLNMYKNPKIICKSNTILYTIVSDNLKELIFDYNELIPVLIDVNKY